MHVEREARADRRRPDQAAGPTRGEGRDRLLEDRRDAAHLERELEAVGGERADRLDRVLGRRVERRASPRARPRARGAPDSGRPRSPSHSRRSPPPSPPRGRPRRARRSRPASRGPGRSAFSTGPRPGLHGAAERRQQRRRDVALDPDRACAGQIRCSANDDWPLKWEWTGAPSSASEVEPSRRPPPKLRGQFS